jgi:hypothetical protein
MNSLRRRGGLVSAGLLCGALWLSSCASARAAQERDAWSEKELGAHSFPAECGALWTRVLHLLAARGFSLAQPDRAAAGEQALDPAIAPFTLSSRTRQTEAGGLTVTTDWNRDWVRYRVVGTPAGPSSCQVAFTRTTQDGLDDPGSTSSVRDWQMSLDLLREVDPSAAARIEAGPAP